MTLTRQQLLIDLYAAFYDARRGKSKRSYVRKWEKNLKANMDSLCEDLYTRRYEPLPSKCFIVDYPKKREIFAAMFRDRIVHHLYFNYTHDIFERTFIADSYSCIKGRGTHFGIQRVTDFCRRASENWNTTAYALHLDIRGYFMHIDRARLLQIATATILKMGTRIKNLNIPFLLWLTEQIASLDPTQHCVIVGDPSDWNGLDPQKSMLHLKPGLGLPIGNLTSQLFSNVYLNPFDQYMKRELHCRYYGRYVDDAIVVSPDREWLLSVIPKIEKYLHDTLGLQLHRGKTTIQQVQRGVEFLGSFIRPYRTYISRPSIQRIEQKARQLDTSCPSRLVRQVNSYLGIFQHTASWRIRRRLFMRADILRYCVFDPSMTYATDRRIYYRRRE